MSAVVRKIRADLRRRRLQVGVLGVIILLASATTTLGLTLLQTSSNPWDRAFEAQRGAHLAVVYDPRLVAPERLASTPGEIGASAWLGPLPLTGAAFESEGRKLTNLVLVGRDDPGGPVADLRMAAGRWVRAPDEIVVTRSFAVFYHVSLGGRLTWLGSLDKPVFTIVGEAIDLDQGDAETSTQFLWVTEARAPSLSPQWSYQMLYRFPRPPTEAQLSADVSTLRSQLPAGAVQSSVNYLLFRQVFNITNQLVLTFLLAFGVFALLASAATVGNLVTGMVIASYREIGIVKAIGYTPAQVVGSLTGLMLVPALAGCALGIPVGTLLSIPLVGRSAEALGLPAQPAIAPLMDAIALAGVLLLVAVAATLPALRAGRLPAVRAIATGVAPQGARVSWPARQLRRLPLPRTLAIGVGDAFARPLRGGLTAVVVLVAVATLVFAGGLRAGLAAFISSLNLPDRVDVTVQRTGPYPDQKVMDVLLAQPQTLSVVGVAGAQVGIPGVADAVNVRAYSGPSESLGVPLVAGRWFQRPGEVLMPRATMDEAHLRLGDSFDGLIDGRHIPLRVVGEVFSVDNFGHEVWMDLSTLPPVQAGTGAPYEPSTYFVRLRPGSDAVAYARRVQASEPDFLDATAHHGFSLSAIDVLNSIMTVLTLVLALIAVAGVFNTLLLTTREKARDLAVLKTIGMTPWQVVALVAAAAAAIGLAGGLLGLPAGIAVYRGLIDALGSFTGNDIPPFVLSVFSPAPLLLAALAGVAVAVLGSLLPGRWAARAHVTEVLRSE